MRNIRNADKWLLSALAIFCLAGCDVNHIVGVVERPERATYTATKDPCIRVKHVPYDRVYKNGDIDSFDRSTMENTCMMNGVER